MKMRRHLFRAVRLSFLLSLLTGPFLLYHLSRTANPYLYYFLTTTPGRRLAGMLHWELLPGHEAVRDRRVADMTKQERRVWEELQEQFLDRAPSHRLLLRNGNSMLGRLLDEGPRFIQFQESYGNHGSLSARIRRSRVLQLDPLASPAPEITYRDVQFKMQFPDLNFHKRHPYTIATDEKYARVEDTVRRLQRLHEEFLETFAPLARSESRGENIQVLFFSDEGAFRAYQRRHAPRMTSSVGFYSPGADRFVVFNQGNSEQMQAFLRRLEAQASRYREKENMYGGAQRIRAWEREAGERMSHMVEQQTVETVRHEGAHQLFFTYGIHSPHRIENEWLYEGLAAYCETEQLGDGNAYRSQLLREALRDGTLIPLEKLVNHRHGCGLFALGHEERVELAYTEAWALVHFLMKPRNRDRFYDYIRHLRDPAHFWSVVDEPRLELLCRFMGRPRDALEDEWGEYLRSL